MPPQPEAEINFETELNALALQATQTIDERPKPKDGPNLAQSLRPLVIGIEAISRAQAEQGKLLAKIESAPSQVDTAALQLGGLKEAWEHKETIMERLFTSLHGELKTYKDDFLFDLLHKPVIKDLITLFDDLTQVQNQLAEVSKSQDDQPIPLASVHQVEKNLRHGIHALEEVLSRLQVEKLPPHEGSLDKKLQKVIDVTDAIDPLLNNTVAQSLRPGFMWRERIIRPEEVVIYRVQS